MFCGLSDHLGFAGVIDGAFQEISNMSASVLEERVRIGLADERGETVYYVYWSCSRGYKRATKM